MILALSLLIGLVAGLRTMTAPAAIAWAAWLGWLDLSGGGAAFMGSGWAVAIFSVLALGEYVGDKLPATPDRRSLPLLAARLVSGAACGAVLGGIAGAWPPGLAAGIAGAAAGTFGGAALRARLAARVGRDRPAALAEDAAAILLGLLAAAAA